MKKQTQRLTVLLCSLSLAASLQAQGEVEDRATMGLSNGRFWELLTEMEKTCYLVGYLDHEKPFNHQQAPDGPIGDKESDWWPWHLDIKEISKGLDNFYAQPENLIFPTRFALRILAMKVAGKPEPEISGWLTTYRKFFIETKQKQPAPTQTAKP